MNALLLALLHSLWQGVALAAVAQLLFLRASRPEVRARIGELAMAAQLFAFLATWWLAAQPAATDAAAPVAAVTGPLLWPLAALWMVGASLLLTRWVLGHLGIWRLRRSSMAAPPALASRFETLAERLGLWNVELRLVKRGVPMAVGVLRPAVLLPASLLARLPMDQVEALLLHELAHVRRHDVLLNALQGLAEALLFHHPTTWWLSRRVRQERELAADALAARLTGDPVVVARALAELAHLRSVQAMPAATSGDLRARVHTLLGLDEASRSPSWTLPLLALAVLLGLAPSTSAQADEEDPSVQTERREARLVERTKRQAEADRAAEEALRSREKAERDRERALRKQEKALRKHDKALRDAERAQRKAAEAAAKAAHIAWSWPHDDDAVVIATDGDTTGWLVVDGEWEARIEEASRQAAEEAARFAESFARRAEEQARQAERRAVEHAEHAKERAERHRREAAERAAEAEARREETMEKAREAARRAEQLTAEFEAATAGDVVVFTDGGALTSCEVVETHGDTVEVRCTTD